MWNVRISGSHRNMNEVILFFLIAITALTLDLNAQSVASVSGTWYGDFVMTGSDGKTSHDKAVLILKHDGAVVTGSAGPTIDQQSAFTNGRIENNSLRFHMDAAGGLDFELHLDGSRLYGTATGTNPRRPMEVVLDLQPAHDLVPQKELTAEITEADQKLFDAFDRCDATDYASFLSDDLEFFRDHMGETDHTQNVQSLKQRCAEGIQLRRELLRDTLVINDLPGYGALEAGTHRFYSRQADGSEHLDATAQFVNIWRKEDGHWKLARAISFNHH